MNYENTEWAKEYKTVCPDAYDLALKIANHPDLMVNIVPKNGLYMIEPRNLVPDFPLAYTYSKEQAYTLCVEMNWSIR